MVDFLNEFDEGVRTNIDLALSLSGHLHFILEAHLHLHLLAL
jgi:hypothetical protein